jgi:chemotaxis protein methyltransferase CheR
MDGAHGVEARVVSHTRCTPPRAALPDVHGLRVPERTLILLRDLVHGHAGLYYDEQRLDFLRDRLSPLAVDRGFDSLLDYYYLLKYDANAEEEWTRAIDALSVQETYFWREFDQVRALVDSIVPRLISLGRRPVRIWSVPCATGEEPLSLAMALEEAGWFDRAMIEIHASDASAAALARARTGRYGARAFRQLSPELRHKYFDADAERSDWTVKSALAARVSSWTRVNVVRASELMLSRCDVIFCRNLFIYFNEASVRQVVEAFADRMPSPGFLCVGASESLLRVTARFDLQDIAGAYVYVKP